MPFIKAIYKYKDGGEGDFILASKEKVGLTLLGGEYAFSAFKALSLGSMDEFEGQFLVGGYDILEDLGNDHPQIIRIDASLPILDDENLPSSQIDMYVDHFAEESNLQESDLPYFRHLFWGIFEALKKRPLYVLVNLAFVDNGYAKAVFDLLSKIMKTYPILVYAPSLEANPKPKTLLFLDGFEEILAGKEEDEEEQVLVIKEGKKDSSDDYEAMDAFFGALEDRLNENEEEEQEEKKKIDDPEALKKKEEKQKKFYNPLFSLIFSILSLLTGVLYMAMESSTLFLVAHLLLSVAFAIMFFATIETSRKSLSSSEFFKKGGPNVNAIMLSGCISMIGVFASIAFMVLKGFKYFHIIFLLFYLLYAVAILAYFLIFRKLMRKKEEKEAWRSPAK